MAREERRDGERRRDREPEQQRRTPMNTRITRRGLAMAAAPAAGILAVACGSTSGGATASQPGLTGPKEINFVGYQSDPLRQSLFDQAWKAAGAAVGVTVNGTWEASADYWTKRQAEYDG